MKLSKNFWRAYKALVLVASDGKIAFTEAGRKELGPQLAKHGIALASIKTVDQFRATMKRVAAMDLAASNREFEELLNHPGTTASERASIRRVLGMPGKETAE